MDGRADLATKLTNSFFLRKKSVFSNALCVTATVIEDPDEMSLGMSVLKHLIGGVISFSI